MKKNEPIKYFVGRDPNGCDAESCMVLEHTMRKHTERDVEIIWMEHSNDPNSFWHGWNSRLWPTPFSGFRWGIPAYCEFQGQAIYSDSDLIWLDDIGKLWDEPFEDGKIVQAKGGVEGWRYCVCKWHNERCGQLFPLPIERLRSLDMSHERMKGFLGQWPQLVQAFKGKDYNCVDGENLPHFDHVGAIHYSSMNHQPHLKYAIPRLEKAGMGHWFDGTVEPHWDKRIIDMFENEYQDALDSGLTVEDYIPDTLYGDFVKLSQANYKGAHQWVK